MPDGSQSPVEKQRRRYKGSGHVPYLRQRRGRYFVQVPVPKALRGRFGKANVERYLGTSSLAEAKQLSHAAVADILASFERARIGGPIRSEELQAQAEVELRRAYDALAADFLDAHGRLPNLAEEIAEDADDLISASFQSNRLLGKPTVDYAEELLDRLGAEKNEESVAALTQAILKAQAAAIAMLQRGMEPPPLNGQPVRRNRYGTAPGVSQVGETFLAERQRDRSARLTAQTAAQHRATFRLFSDYMQDAPLDTITRDDAAGFLDAMAGLHRHYGRRPGAAKLTLHDLLKRFPAGDGDGLSNRTINRHQSALKTLFRWARKRGMVEGENPFADLARPKARQSEVAWLPFTVAELNTLFAGAQFEIQPDRHTLATARPWIMAVALFSGMRQGEICELEAHDIQRQDGVWFFDVTEAKSEAGVRRVPVHTELLALKFLEYVHSVSSGPLFPGLTPSGPDRKRGHTLAKRFPEYRRSRGVDRARVKFHSFRKCFVRALELAKVDRDRAAQVIGHERGFTFRAYNPEGVDVAGLREVVEAVRYSGLKIRG
jgi:integrase